MFRYRYEAPLPEVCQMAQDGDLEGIKSLVLQRYYNVNAVTEYGNNALYYAAEKGHHEVMEYLIEEHKMKFSSKSRVLDSLAFHGDDEKIKYYIKHGANVNFSDWSLKITALHQAAERGNLTTVKILVENGADINAINYRGWNPLHVAAHEGRYEVVKYLIEECKLAFIPNKPCIEWYPYAADFKTIKYFLFKENDDELLKDDCPDSKKFTSFKYFIENGAEVEKSDSEAMSATLHSVVYNGYIKAMEYIIGKGVSMKEQGSKPLLDAVGKGHLDMVKLLVSNGADISSMNSEGYNILHIAVKHCHYEMAKYLIEECGVKFAPGKDSLNLASYRGDFEEIKYFVSHGADVNAQDNFSATALHNAAKEGNLDIVKYLIEKGGKINTLNYKHFNVLHSAADLDWHNKEQVEKKLEVVKYLIEEHEARFLPGKFVFDIVIRRSSFEMVKYFVEHGADIHAKIYSHKTAIDLAFDERHLEIVKFFIGKGLGPDATNIFDHSLEYEHPRIYKDADSADMVSIEKCAKLKINKSNISMFIARLETKLNNNGFVSTKANFMKYLIDLNLDDEMYDKITRITKDNDIKETPKIEETPKIKDFISFHNDSEGYDSSEDWDEFFDQEYNKYAEYYPHYDNY